MEKSEIARGFVIRTHNLSDTSLIVHLFLDQRGITKLVAKGAKSKRSPFAGTLELLNEVEVLLAPARGDSDLHKLLEVKLLGRQEGMRASYPRLLLASYFSALIDYWVSPDQEIRQAFDLFQRAIQYVDTGEVSWKGVGYFEQELSILLGYSKRPEEVQKLHRASPKLSTLRQQVEKSWKPS